MDNKGIDWYVSGGPALGASGPVEAGFWSGNLNHQTQLTVSRDAKFMAIGGMGMSREGTYQIQMIHRVP